MKEVSRYSNSYLIKINNHSVGIQELLFETKVQSDERKKLAQSVDDCQRNRDGMDCSSARMLD